jgi:hypothetical protein
MNDPSQIRQPILMRRLRRHHCVDAGHRDRPSFAAQSADIHQHAGSTRVNMADSRGFDAGRFSVNVTS